MWSSLSLGKMCKISAFLLTVRTVAVWHSNSRCHMLQGSASAGWDPSCVYSIYKQYSLNVYTCADENERFQNLIVNGWTRLNHTRTDIYIYCFYDASSLAFCASAEKRQISAVSHRAKKKELHFRSSLALHFSWLNLNHRQNPDVHMMHVWLLFEEVCGRTPVSVHI